MDEQPYLFFCTTIGEGTKESPFRPSTYAYGKQYRANDGRTDPTNPDSSLYSMLVEVGLTQENLDKAKNDPRMAIVIFAHVPARSELMVRLMTNAQRDELKAGMIQRRFDPTGIDDATFFCDFYRYLLFEFRIRTLLKDDYFKVDLDECINLGDNISMCRRLADHGLDYECLNGHVTPRQVIQGIWSQRKVDALHSFFSTHLDLPQSAGLCHA